MAIKNQKLIFPNCARDLEFNLVKFRAVHTVYIPAKDLWNRALFFQTRF
jgi:hypothetical protein